jgi:hypothetical protein
MTSTQPKPFVFVLMPFDSAFDDIYKFGIKGAADDVGAYAERVDEQMYAGGILDRIFNQISKADAIVADMTGRNPNVFYEVGYAHALGKVVLLLTQNADDIPFDLKHQPHIVYGGKIETLRTALAPKLQWAIAESRKQRRGEGQERISVRILGRDVSHTEASAPFDLGELPTVAGTIEGRSFRLPIHLRNDSLEGIVGVTHVYLFCSPKSTLVPCEYKTVINTGAYQTITGAVTREEAVALDSFAANSNDAPDGLRKQFRIKTNFGAAPPGAVEEINLTLMFREGHNKCDDVYRLRLHSARQYHDFRFRLQIEVKAPARDNVEPTSAGS